MAVLKLGAIDFDHGSRIVQQRLRSGLYNAGLSGAGRTQEQKVSIRPAGDMPSSESGKPHDLVNRFLLSNDKWRSSFSRSSGRFPSVGSSNVSFGMFYVLPAPSGSLAYGICSCVVRRRFLWITFPIARSQSAVAWAAAGLAAFLSRLRPRKACD